MICAKAVLRGNGREIWPYPRKRRVGLRLGLVPSDSASLPRRNGAKRPVCGSSARPFWCKSEIRRKSAGGRSGARFGHFVVVLRGMKEKAVRLRRTLSRCGRGKAVFEVAAAGSAACSSGLKPSPPENATRGGVQKLCPGPRQA